MRADLRQCVALVPVASEDLPAVAAEEPARSAQVQERAFWMRRDLDQTANNREMCNRTRELVTMIDANNAGPQR